MDHPPKKTDKRDIKRDISDLKADAAQIMGHISKLSSRLGDATKGEAGDIPQQLAEEFSDEIAAAKAQLSDLKDLISRYTVKLEDRTRENPLLYLALAFGLGSLLGKFLSSADRR